MCFDHHSTGQESELDRVTQPWGEHAVPRTSALLWSTQKLLHQTYEPYEVLAYNIEKHTSGNPKN